MNWNEIDEEVKKIWKELFAHIPIEGGKEFYAERRLLDAVHTYLKRKGKIRYSNGVWVFTESALVEQEIQRLLK